MPSIVLKLNAASTNVQLSHASLHTSNLVFKGYEFTTTGAAAGGIMSLDVHIPWAPSTVHNVGQGNHTLTAVIKSTTSAQHHSNFRELDLGATGSYIPASFTVTVNNGGTNTPYTDATAFELFLYFDYVESDMTF